MFIPSPVSYGFYLYFLPVVQMGEVPRLLTTQCPRTNRRTRQRLRPRPSLYERTPDTDFDILTVTTRP
jgi:hypothetical protein